MMRSHSVSRIDAGNMSMLLGFCYAGPMVGYPFLASLMSALQIGDSRLPSVVFRVAVVVVALIAIWRAGLAQRVYRPGVLVSFLVFWTLYIARIVEDSYIQQIPLPIQTQEMLIMAFMFALLPALPGFAGLDLKDSKMAFKTVSIVSIGVLLLVLIDFQRILLALAEKDLLRFQLERLNPVALSTTGGLLVVLGVFGAFRPDPREVGLPRILLFLMIVGGFVAMMLGASRGPVLACLIALLSYASLPFRVFRFIGSIAAGALVATVGYFAYTLVSTNFSFDVLERIMAGLEGREQSANLHAQAMAGAFEQFLENPLLGGSILEATTGFYTHNAVLEALMATGTTGFAAYSIVLAASLMASFRVLMRGDLHAWLSLTTIYYCVLAQTGGSHYASGPHWLTMAGIVVTDARAILAEREAAALRRSGQMLRPWGADADRWNSTGGRTRGSRIG